MSRRSRSSLLSTPCACGFSIAMPLDTCLEFEAKNVSFGAQLRGSPTRRSPLRSTPAISTGPSSFRRSRRTFGTCCRPSTPTPSASVRALRLADLKRRARALEPPAAGDRPCRPPRFGVSLDVAATGWTPTVDNFLGRVTKARIVQAVREAKGADVARQIEPLKKGDMAREAEVLLTGDVLAARAAAHPRPWVAAPWKRRLLPCRKKPRRSKKAQRRKAILNRRIYRAGRGCRAGAGRRPSQRRRRVDLHEVDCTGARQQWRALFSWRKRRVEFSCVGIGAPPCAGRRGGLPVLFVERPPPRPLLDRWRRPQYARPEPFRSADGSGERQGRCRELDRLCCAESYVAFLRLSAFSPTIDRFYAT